jgi:protein-tyrosine phosphatase
MASTEVVPEVLFVCTANICRSPMAEAILAGRLRDLGAQMRVGSTGLRAVGGPADEIAREVLATRGLDLSRHKSTGVTPRDIMDATLVLVMERAHLIEIGTTVPGSWSRTFGLTEVVALGERHGPRRADESIGEWLARLQVHRDPSGVLQAGTEFDIADPHGGTVAAYERCADQLTRLIDALVVLLCGTGAAPGGQ